MISRRNLFWLLLAGALALQQSPAYAEDDGTGDGTGDGGGSDYGGSDDGGDSSGGSSPTGPGSGGEDGENDDQNQALEAVKNGHAASLKEILVIVRKEYEGEIVHVGLDGAAPNLIYRIKLLDANNQLIEVLVNPVSRSIVRAQGT